MSTLWFDSHCGEVHSVEDNPIWFETIKRRVKSAHVYLLSGDTYFRKIEDFPERYFDLIVIDGSQRLACFHIARDRLKIGGTLLVDNTDKDRTTHGDLYEVDRLLESSEFYMVRRFTGWSPGLLFPQETTIALRLK